MDDPTPTTPVARPVLGTLGMAIATDALGNQWLSVTHNYGSATFTYGMPIDEVDTFVTQFAANARELVAEAKRAKLGLPGKQLIVPSGQNGRYRHHGRG